MQIYISRNNQQSGPLEEAQVLAMLKSGQLSPNDMAIRQGDREWQKLGNLFPDVGDASPPSGAASVAGASASAAAAGATSSPAAVAGGTAAPIKQNSATPKKSKKGLLLGCGGFFLILLLAGAVLGFLAFRNLKPADSLEDLPETVKDMKLDTRYPPKGDIWGTETQFVGFYSDATKSQKVLYLMTVYKDEQTAKDALSSELARSCKSGETPMYFSFKDKSGTEVSQGATCAVPLYVQKGNRLAAIGGSGATVETFITFAENLPFNAGTTMIKK